ncbi:helix-turn-helix transcriptional regulator [Bauldia sp.]|uniref:helix-turn-helix transcriptional regulator n=1 Tax=Bauldia sp. TaxID=2575872 RepID=UPI003BA85189
MRGGGIPDRLLSLVYATQTDRTVWRAVCEELNHVLSVPIMMFGHNLARNESLGIVAGGLDPSEVNRYHEHFADQNPWMHMNLMMPAGQVGTSDQALERRELFKTAFYNDWLRRQENIVAGPFMMCHRTRDTFVGLAAACRQRDVEDTLPIAQCLLEALAPHLNRAITYASLTRSADPPSLAYLRASRHAVVLLSQSGRVAFTNPSADRFLKEQRFFAIDTSDRLHADGPETGTFLAGLTSVCTTGKPSDLPDPLCLYAADGRVFVMHAHWFPDEAQDSFPSAAWSDPITAALVVAGGYSQDSARDFGRIAHSFGATPAEAKLAAALMLGETLSDYADRNRLSRHTVRNQMRALLQKSGAGSQGSFIRRMGYLASPFDSLH